MELSAGNSSPVDGGKIEVQHVEVQADIEPTILGRKIKRHCARWWWVHTSILCLMALIIALCLVYVGMPRIAQDGINASTLTLSSLQFLNPTPDSFTLSANATQYSSSIFTPTIDAFIASMHLVTNGSASPNAITQIAMPQIHVRHPNTNIAIDNQKVPVLNFDQVTDFAIQILNQENLTVRIEGMSKLHEGALPVFKISYNSSLTFEGLNGLPGFNITDTKVNISAAPGEPNMSGVAIFPNPTIVTVELGNVTMLLSTSKEGVIGNCTLNNFTLKPGINQIPMTATVNSSAVVSSVGSDGLLDLLILGQYAVYNGVHLTYYEKALQSHALKLQINFTAILESSI
ncbi:hypothetical protein OIDMADRAFT_46754 [Oidiodendron maius Zn]|uniref:Uncharacterized protein n=1 Tax=Oidiodendron maius (strain Zn) TaxID=913774 RepID=A0A0C3D681_OIDMZ|nr:hypothetical protein OIDMADRAFT_46754 [Oidiodendron maius Zn]